MSHETEQLTALVGEIESVVQTAAHSAGMTDADVRRLLRFLAQVVQVVEQAFQDVLGLLVEVSYLSDDELSNPRRMGELGKTAAMLTARSHYRDAAEICSRLKHLSESFDNFIRPTVQHLPEFTSWAGVFGLIEHREGRIIALVEQTAREIERLLEDAAPGTLRQIRSEALTRATELRSLLGELHALNGRIVGYSGRAGFLQLTSNRAELQREVNIMIDKRDQSLTQGHRVSFGDGANITNSNLVIANSIQDSFKTIQSSGVDSSLKQQLELLCKQIDLLLPHLPEEKRGELSQDLSGLVAEATKARPRRKWYELSAQGIVDAAKTCGAVAAPVISTVNALLALLT
jgi:hypothetical protein